MPSSPTGTTTCQHDWKNDPMFESGAVIMEFDFEPEMRQYCIKCKAVRYIPTLGDKGN